MNAKIAEPKLLTVPEAAAMLRVSRATLYRMIAAREIPGVVHLRGAVRIKRTALERHIEELAEEHRPRRKRAA